MPTALSAVIDAPTAVAPGSGYSYRAASYRDDVIYRIASELNTDPVDLRPETATAWARKATSHVRTGWDYWPWKQFERTEERAYRQVYYSRFRYPAGSEVYYLTTGAYFRAMEDIGAGESPSAASAKWEPITCFHRTVAFEQFGKEPIAQVMGAYPMDPRRGYGWITRRAVPFTASAHGIDVPHYSSTVWLTYKPRQPRFTGEEYDPSKTYPAGGLVYDSASGECYRTCAAGKGSAISGSHGWHRQRFPYALSEYVALMVAADFAEDAATKGDLRQSARMSLHREIDKEAEQGVTLSYTLHEQQSCFLAAGYAAALPVIIYPVLAAGPCL